MTRCVFYQLDKDMALVNLNFPASYDDMAAALPGCSGIYVVADRNVSSLYAQPIMKALEHAGAPVKGLMEIRCSERLKTYKSVEKIQSWLIAEGADRYALLLAVGGGITTDLVGFAACTYKRGVKYANVPTTLLSMVDAGIGGKTGCNIGSYKNMAGIIKQPHTTFIMPWLCRSLSRQLFCDGYAELLKTFIIGDAEAYDIAVRDKDHKRLDELISRAASIKAKIVEADPDECGLRKVLNLGHSFAHAIEFKSAHAWLPWHRHISHGQAVAMGMIMAARMSEELKLAQAGLADRLTADFRSLGLPTESPWDFEDLRPIMRTDKKSKDGKVSFILIASIGKVVMKDIGL